MSRATARPGDPVPVLLTVVDARFPEPVHEFPAEGTTLSFGRDPECDLVPRDSAGEAARLSRRAGVIWRMGGELWVRNLSTAHDLHLEVPGLPPEPPLPPRLPSSRGPARSIPGDLTYLRAPGGCELFVRQLHTPSGHADDDGGTARLTPVPRSLLPVAVALCEPLLHGSQLPASYRQIGERTGAVSRKAVRNQVDALVQLYAAEAPALGERIERRLRREAAHLQAPGPARLRGGIWHFDPPPAHDDGERRAALALPDYYEIAHLLVRHRLVHHQHLPLLLPGDRT